MWTLLAACVEITTLPTDGPATSPTPTATDGTPPPPTGDTGAPTDPTTPTTPEPTVLGALAFDGPLPTRLLVISLDTTRRDHVGFFSGSGLTPNLDRVMGEAVVLANHHSCSNWTGPSMTCVVSGRTPMENGFWPWTSDPEVRGRPPRGYGDDTLPGRLRRAGYATTLVTANGVFSRDLGTSEGYETEIRVDWQPAAQVREAALRALDALEVERGRPWLFHVHFIDPHGSYCAPDAYLAEVGATDAGFDRGQWCYDSYGAQDAAFWPADDARRAEILAALDGQYDAELLYWDAEFGRFWEALDARGALDDTLVAFVTDHGQQFYERGGHGHGLALAPEENASTAWFWARTLRPAVLDEATFHPDVTATLYAAADVRPGLPQTGLLVGTAPPGRAVHAMNTWGAGDVRLSVVAGDRQLLYDWWGERALYRLDADPLGFDDRYDPDDPDVVALWGEMDSWIATVRASWPHLADPVQPGP